MNAPKQYDVIIVGGGMVGLLFAALLAEHNFSIAIIEAHEPVLKWSDNSRDARVSSINIASKHMFQHLSVWDDFSAAALAPLRCMDVWDNMGGGDIQFDAADVGKAELGYIVDNREVVRVLWQHLQTKLQVDFFIAKPQLLATYDDVTQLTLTNDVVLNGKLLVGADGGQSWLRETMNVPVTERSYNQQAIVAVTHTEKPHRYTALQSFMNEGPLGILPLADQHEMAFVWSSTVPRAQELLQHEREQFELELVNALGSKLGDMRLLTEPKAIPLTMRHAKFYVGDGFALIGDAAHSIHPLAGQGVNLGFMDAACLAEVIVDAAAADKAWYEKSCLRRYERWRKGYNQMMLCSMRGFKELFTDQSPWVVQLRSQGLNVTNKCSVLKNCFARYAMGDVGDLPKCASIKSR